MVRWAAIFSVLVLGMTLAAPRPVGAAVSVDQVIELHKAGLDSDLIIQHVRARGIDFEVGPDTLIRLKGAGVDEKILVALLDIEPDEARPDGGEQEKAKEDDQQEPRRRDKTEKPAKPPDLTVPNHAGPALPAKIEELRPKVEGKSATFSELMAYAQQCQEAQLFRQAADSYADAAKMHPEDPRPWLGLASAGLERGRAAEAVLSCERVLTLDAGHVKAYTILGRIHAYKGEMAKAAELLAKAVAETGHELKGATNKDLGQLQQLYAETLVRLGSPGDALKAAQAAVRHDKKNAAAWLLLARLSRESGQLDAAKLAMRKLRAVDAADVPLEVYMKIDLERGRIHLARGEGERAVAALAAMNPAQARLMHVRLFKALALVAARRTTEAITEFEEICKEEPENIEALVGLGRAHFARKAYRGALESFRKATEVDPGHAAAQYNRAMIALQIAEKSAEPALYRESRQAFDAYLQKEPVGEAARIAKGNIQHIEAKLAQLLRRARKKKRK